MLARLERITSCKNDEDIDSVLLVGQYALARFGDFERFALGRFCEMPTSCDNELQKAYTTSTRKRLTAVILSQPPRKRTYGIG
jgi:hypothetical protein